jgi:DNA-directed RNA polymerase III subunit RPC8
MFSLHTIDAAVALEPNQLGLDTVVAIERALRESYMDRVLHNVGLVVTVYDVIYIGEGRIFHSDARVYYEVSFRAVVFRPEVGSLLVCTLKSQTPSGMYLSLGFFEDIYISVNNMEEDETTWSEEEKRWIYHPDEESVFEFETGKKIVVRVYELEFQTGHDIGKHRPRFSVSCRINSPCLGMLSWDWEGEDDDGEDAG